MRTFVIALVAVVGAGAATPSAHAQARPTLPLIAIQILTTMLPDLPADHIRRK